MLTDCAQYCRQFGPISELGGDGSEAGRAARAEAAGLIHCNTAAHQFQPAGQDPDSQVGNTVNSTGLLELFMLH